MATVAAVAASLAACASQKPRPVDFSAGPRDYDRESYGDVYELWTRHDTVIKEVEMVLEVWATYKSADYREAFVARYADLYNMSGEARDKLRASQREAAATGYEFVVTTQSNNYRWNDLDRKNSPWRLMLVDAAGRQIPSESIKLERWPDMYERAFYPVKGPFTKTYTVRFLRPAAVAAGAADDTEFSGERSGQIALRVAGPLGHVDLVWASR